MKVITVTSPVSTPATALPRSYADIVSTYGYGTYCGLIVIAEPDDEVIPTTFGGLDLWDFDDTFTFTARDFSNAIQLAYTVDGDIISYVAHEPNQLLVLPRPT